MVGRSTDLGAGLPWVWGGPVPAVLVDDLPGHGGPGRMVVRSVVTSASPESLFLWLSQLRRAPYSYDWLDNFGRRSPRSPKPELMRLSAGQTVMTIFTLTAFVPDESVTVRMKPGWPTRAFGAITLTYRIEPIGPGRTRLVAMMRMPPVGRVLGRARRYALACGDLFMMRKQLLTLAALAANGPDAGEVRRSRGGR